MITWQSIKNEAEAVLCTIAGVVIMIVLLLTGPLLVAGAIRASKRMTQDQSHADEAMAQWISNQSRQWK
jgi:hypothetical protein